MEKYTPARKISNRNGLGKVTGLFFSHKMNMYVSWESQLERDYCYLLDFNKKIKFFFHNLRLLISPIVDEKLDTPLIFISNI